MAIIEPMHRNKPNITYLLKIVKFDLDWAFPDCNSSLNSLMANVTQVSIHQWLRNDAQSLK